MYRKYSVWQLVLLGLIIIAVIGIIIGISSIFQTNTGFNKVRGLLPDKKSKQEEEATIKEVVGRVERMRGNEAWSSVYVGDRLKPQDSLRTGVSGKANLELGQSAQLTVSEQTQIKVEKLFPDLHEFSLQHGHVNADYSSHGQRKIRIGGQQSAFVEASNGQFHVLKTPTAYGVATEKGAVRFQSASSAIEVNDGEWSVALHGQPPSEPAKIPAKLLLKVAAASRVSSNPCAVLEGVASPGAEVTIGSQVIGAGLDGRFRWESPSSTDSPKGHIRVLARHLIGKVHARNVLCEKPNNKSGRNILQDEGSRIYIESIKIRW